MPGFLGRTIVGMCLCLSALALSGTIEAGSASARERGVSTRYAHHSTTRQAVRRRVRQPSQAQGGQYFVEFRARYALSYGHTFAAFGRLDASGNIRTFEVAGLHPAGESSVPWMVGHLLPVPSETGPSDGDMDPQYISARYRVTMDEAEYTKVVAKIRQMQRSTPLWSATLYNCNSFVGDIARFMGLRADIGTMQVPPSYIASLKALNNGQSVISAGSI